MRKLAFLLVTLLVVIGTSAQVDTVKVRQIVNAHGYLYKNGGFDSSITFPQDTFRLKSTWKGIAFKGTVPYYWNGSKWEAFGTLYGIDTMRANIYASLAGKVPTTRTLTINGVTYDLSANRTWTISGTSDTSVFIVDTLYNRIATTINADSLRLKSLLVMHGTDTAAAVTTDSTLKITVPKIDTSSLSTRINAKVDTSAVVVFDTTGALTGYELYIDRTGADTIKTRVATGGVSDNDSTFKLSFTIGDENSPPALDSSLVHSKFLNRNIKLFINGVYFHQRDSMGYERLGWSDSITIHKPGGWDTGDRVDVWITDTLRYEYVLLEAPSTPPSTTIAYVNSADGGNNGGSSNSRTFSYTVGSASNTILLVGFVGDVIGGADDVSSVTYNGVAMTLVNKTDNTTGGRYQYLYYLLNPASGAHNVVVTCASTHYIIAGAAEYSGVQSIESNTTNNTALSTLTTTVTTVANNCWNVIFSGSPGAVSNASTGSTKRANSSIEYWTWFDSGGAITPAGSYSMTTTLTAGSKIGHCLAVLKPY